MALQTAQRVRLKGRAQTPAARLHFAAMNLIRRYQSGDGVFLAAMLSLTCVLIISWAISMR